MSILVLPMAVLLNILVSMLLSSLVSESCADVAKTNDVTISKISPADSSLWIGTRDRGLIRVGRNRKAFSYSNLKGDFPCDEIVALAFDSTGVLWMKDAVGQIFSYSSLSGFVPHEDAPDYLTEELDTAAKGDDELSASLSVAASELSSRTSSSALGQGRWLIYLLAFLLLASILIIYRLLAERTGKSGSSKDVKTTKQSFCNPALPPDNSTSSGASSSPSKINKRIEFPVPASDSSSIPVLSENADTPSPIKDNNRPSNTVRPAIVTESNVANSEFYGKLLALIDEKYSDPSFGVEDIAQHFGISRVHLNRRLKNCSESSPSIILKSVRMNKALELLESGEYSIVDVASRCGFSSASYFSTAFKEYFDKSPSSFL